MKRAILLLIFCWFLATGLALAAPTPTATATATPVPTPVIYPNEWDGITDNQGHTLTINNDGTIPVTSVPPTATPTATATPAPTATP